MLLPRLLSAVVKNPVVFHNKESVIDWMLTNIRLGFKDKRTLGGILLGINKNSWITTNQSNLVDKIIANYHRQFHKHEVNTHALFSLPWECSVLQSDEKYTVPYLSYHGDHFLLSCPYNTKFGHAMESEQFKGVSWDTEKKKYYIPFNITLFRDLLSLLSVRFTTYNTCSAVTDFLERMHEYQTYVYDPTLMMINGRYYIISSNDHLQSYIDSNLGTNFYDGIEPWHLAKLVQFGVIIDDSVVSNLSAKHGRLLELAVSHKWVVNLEKNSNQLVNDLVKIGCEYVYFSGIDYWFDQFNELAENFKKAGIMTNIDHCELLERNSHGCKVKYKNNKRINNSGTVVIRYQEVLPGVVFKEPRSPFKIVAGINYEAM